MSAEALSPSTRRFSVERGLRLIAGLFVMLSALLGATVSPHWLWFTGFVGLNLFQSAFTNWCPMMALLGRCGLPRGDRQGGGSE